jgi:hypothetical protein
MRALVPGLFLCMAALFPKSGNAQVYQFRTPAPGVTAANADWQINSEPVMVDGVIYYPTRGFRQFDGQVMMQVGLFRGVPVYADATLEPYSELYAPVGGLRMRAYEARRDGVLAGTTASRVPSFVGMLRTEPWPGQPGAQTSPVGAGRDVDVPAPTDATSGFGSTPSVGIYNSTIGTVVAYGAGASGSAVEIRSVRDRQAASVSTMESILRPAGNLGVWLQFNGARWYASGRAESFSPDRFEPAGDYEGFSVYRDKTRNDGRIWIAVVTDGPLAPYANRQPR